MDREKTPTRGIPKVSLPKTTTTSPGSTQEIPVPDQDVAVVERLDSDSHGSGTSRVALEFPEDVSPEALAQILRIARETGVVITFESQGLQRHKPTMAVTKAEPQEDAPDDLGQSGSGQTYARDLERVISALGDPACDFRTARGLAKDLNLDLGYVQKIINDGLGTTFRSPLTKTRYGTRYYCLKSSRKRNREHLSDLQFYFRRVVDLNV